VHAATSSAASPAFVPRASTASADRNSPKAQSRRTVAAVVADIGSGSFTFFLRSPGGKVNLLAEGSAAAATGERHLPETDLLQVSVFS
jgi:hypothetical protein